jgi:TolB protein
MDPMTGMGPIVRRALVAIAAGFIIRLPLHPAAADGGAGHQLRFSIAASDASDNAPAGGLDWPEVSQIITAETTASGRFLPVEPSTPIVENVSAVPQFDKWRSIDTDVLVTGRVTPAPNRRLKVEFRLWDLASRKLLIAQQYFLGPEEPLPVPHLIAAAILKCLRGE